MSKRVSNKKGKRGNSPKWNNKIHNTHEGRPTTPSAIQQSAMAQLATQMRVK